MQPPPAPKTPEPEAPAPAAPRHGAFEFPRLGGRSLLVLLVATLMLGGGLAFLFARAQVAPGLVLPPEKPAQGEAPAPAPAVPGSIHFEPLVASPAPFSPLRYFPPPIEPVNNGAFASQGQVVAFADIDTVPFEAACFDDNGALWACGILVRAALFTKIRTGTLVCQPKANRALDATVSPGWVCLHNGEDVAFWMIGQGFARPLPGAPLSYLAEAQAARAARRGLWNGNWSVRGAAPGEVPVAPQTPPRRR